MDGGRGWSLEIGQTGCGWIDLKEVDQGSLVKFSQDPRLERKYKVRVKEKYFRPALCKKGSVSKNSSRKRVENE